MEAKVLRAKSKPETSTDKRYLAAIGGVIFTLVAGVAYWAWTDTPQLAADSDVYASLDALFTAVTARREPLVASCESELAAFHSAGKIPERAWRRIVRVIDLTKTGQWESAAEQLYSFIEHQKLTT